MGILDTLEQTNEDFKENVSEPLLDNETFSVQNTVRGTIGAVSGADASDPDEFAEDSSETFYDVNQAIATPGRVVGENTEGNWLTDNTAQVGEAGYEILAEDLGAIAYGTATGANVRTNDPDHATGGYTPGILDAGELALTVGTGGTGKLATSGAKVAGKSAVKGADDVAKVAGKATAKSPNDMGALSKAGTALTRLWKGSDEAASAGRGAQKARYTAKASDEAVEATKDVSEAFLPRSSRIAEDLKLPDYLRTTAAGSVDTAKSAAKAAPRNRWVQAGAVGGGIAAALGLGGAPDLPGNHTVADTFDGGNATLIEESDNADTVLGYWLSLGQDGGEYTILNSSGQSTSTVDFPVSRTPTFDSPGQARNAYTTYVREMRNDNDDDNSYDNDYDDQSPSGWGEATVLKPLQKGWYLVEQAHTQKDRYRYLVTGKDSSGALLYVGSSGTTRTDPVTFGSVDKATAAYQKWLNSGNAKSPDPRQDRPRSADINDDQSSGGALGMLGTAAGIGLAGAIGLLLYKVLLA